MTIRALQLIIVIATTATVLNIFFFKHTAPTEIYTLSLHDALPIARQEFCHRESGLHRLAKPHFVGDQHPARDRKSTRLNSSHMSNSYAVFCLKKKKIAPERDPGVLFMLRV